MLWFSQQYPEVSAWCMKLYHLCKGVRGEKEKRAWAYLRIELVDLFNGKLDIPSEDCITYIDPLLNCFNVRRRDDIGLFREFLGG